MIFADRITQELTEMSSPCVRVGPKSKDSDLRRDR